MEDFFHSKIPGISCCFELKSYLIPKKVSLKPREKDYIAGRRLVFRALKRFGVEAEIPRGPSGEPLWPQGFTGSISHSTRFCLCVIGKSPPFISLGCDVEEIGRFSLQLSRKVLTRWEQEHYGKHLPSLAVSFCTKEAFYKLQYPLFKKRIRLKDIKVHIDWKKQIVTAYSFITCHGNFTIIDGSVVVVIHLRE